MVSEEVEDDVIAVALEIHGNVLPIFINVKAKADLVFEVGALKVEDFHGI